MNDLTKDFIFWPRCHTIFFTYPTPIETCASCGNVWKTKKKKRKKKNFFLKIFQIMKIYIKMKYIKLLIKKNKNLKERGEREVKSSIIVRKEPMTEMDWHYAMSLDAFIRAIESGEQTDYNTAMAFFAKVNPKTGEGEIYYEPAIHSLDITYLRKMRDMMHFKYVIVFGGGGIEDE